MSQLDNTFLQFFLLSFCPLFSMFQLTLWGSRNSSVAGRVVHHSLQTGMRRKKRSHRDGCIHLEFFQPPWPHSTGMTLVIVRPWSSLPRDPLPGPGMPWAHSSPSFLLCLLHALPLYSALTQITMKPTRTGLFESPLHWCCERSALQVSRYISARVRHLLSLPKEQLPRQ